MRKTIQLISLSIVVVLGLVLTSVDKIEGMTPFSKQLTSIVTLIYMFIFLMFAIDPNQIRIIVFGHFKPYIHLIIFKCTRVYMSNYTYMQVYSEN